MHEISIIESILEVAERKAREANSPSITVIKLRVGQFTAIAREALEFAFEVARLGTLAERARLEIEVVPMVLHCVVCDVTTQPTRAMCLICQSCGFPLKIVSGKELQIDYIEIDEHCPSPRRQPEMNLCADTAVAHSEDRVTNRASDSSSRFFGIDSSE